MKVRTRRPGREHRIIDKVRNFFFPRNVVKLDRWDTWSVDYTMTQIILPLLQQFRHDLKYTSSVPFLEEFYDETGKELVDSPIDSWKEIIDTMIIGFQDMWDEHHNVKWDEYTFGDIDNVVHIKEDGSMKISGEYLQKVRESQEKRQKSLELFAKHYQQLWT